MSEILSQFIVQTSPTTIVVDTNTITVTPDSIELSVYTGAAPVAGGANNNVQFNDNGQLQGSNAFTFNATSNVVTIANLVIGNEANLGTTANVVITGGTNGYFLQTDGTGNLTWAAYPGNISGNNAPGGSNTQIQYNDGGTAFGGSAGFTFDNVSNVMSAPGNITAAGKITGVDAALGNAVTANYFIGNLHGYANNAIVADQVSQAFQPNITQTGTMTFLNVTGAITGGNMYANTGTISANTIIGTNLVSALSNLSVGGTTSIQQAKEKITTEGTGAIGTINFDVLTQAILFKTANATGNFTINVRGNSSVTLDSVMSSNESMTVCLINTNGATAFYANVFQIDGSNITPLYVANNTPTSGTSLGKDQYIYNIIKTAANTYTVLGSKTGFA
jgi:hypothetical protein